MADQELLDKYAPTLDAMETKEAYLLDGELYIRHEFRDPAELQTRMTYHKVGADNVVSNDNLIMLGVWARAQKQGERVKYAARREFTKRGETHERVLRS